MKQMARWERKLHALGEKGKHINYSFLFFDKDINYSWELRAIENRRLRFLNYLQTRKELTNQNEVWRL